MTLVTALVNWSQQFKKKIRARQKRKLLFSFSLNDSDEDNDFVPDSHDSDNNGYNNFTNFYWFCARTGTGSNDNKHVSFGPSNFVTALEGFKLKSVPDLLVRVVLLSTNDAFEPLGAAFLSLFRRSCNKSWLLSQKGERSTCPEIRYFAMVRYSTKLYIPSTIKICA